MLDHDGTEVAFIHISCSCHVVKCNILPNFERHFRGVMIVIYIRCKCNNLDFCVGFRVWAVGVGVTTEGSAEDTAEAAARAPAERWGWAAGFNIPSLKFFVNIAVPQGRGGYDEMIEIFRAFFFAPFRKPT